MTESLIITEIYKSVQGESVYAGLPCTLLDLQDVLYVVNGAIPLMVLKVGKSMILPLLEQTKTLGVELVEITGGEPLAQKKLRSLHRPSNRRRVSGSHRDFWQ